MKKCKINDCKNNVKTKGLCSYHYKQKWRYGIILGRTTFTPNDIIIEKDYALIVIRDKNLNIVGKSKIDIEDLEKCSKYKWCLCSGYVKSENKGKPILLHRLVMDFPADKIVDHKNHNLLDNRKSELRVCTFSQNNSNRASNNNSSSKYKGVSWNKSRKKWISVVCKNNTDYYLGGFSIEEEAARAYDKKAKELHGEFAYLNFPENNLL